MERDSSHMLVHIYIYTHICVYNGVMREKLSTQYIHNYYIHTYRHIHTCKRACMPQKRRTLVQECAFRLSTSCEGFTGTGEHLNLCPYLVNEQLLTNSW